MRISATLLAALLPLSLPLFLIADPGPATPSTEELRRRYKNRKVAERTHQESMEAEREQRRRELRALGIHGVEILRREGDPARSVDIAFIGDGFAEGDQAEWAKVVATMAANFDTAPFDAYAKRVNLYRVDLVAEVSGTAIDDPTVEAPLAGTAVAFPGGKLLRCDVKRAAEYVRKAVPEVDYLMVVLNTHGKFKASANSGAIVTLSTAGGHQRSIVVHEFGHNFGGLYDEYVDPKQSGTGPPPARIANGLNVSLLDNVHLTKWHHFNIPEKVFRGEAPAAGFEPEDHVRCYEGGATFTDGVYRPEENCHMQRGRGKAFCRVCTEAQELALYRFFPPFTAVSPAVESLTVGASETLDLEVVPVDLAEGMGSVRVAWFADGGRVKGEGRGKDPTMLRLKASKLGVGTHAVTATMSLDSPRVHMDRGRLSASYTWTVTVVTSGPALGAPERVFGDVTKPLVFTVEAPSGWELASAPDGAAFDPETGEFRWVPEPEDFGGWWAEFERTAGGPPDRQSVLLAVRSPEKRRNLDPKPLFEPPHTLRQGETLDLGLLAFDPDGDHLGWTATGLPPGAVLERNTGRLTWTPGHAVAGEFEIALEATDGVRRAKTTLSIRVEAAALFRGMFRIDPAKLPACDGPVERWLLGLHHPVPARRLAASRALADAPPQARLAESIRLIREVHPGISAAAFDHLEAHFTAAPRSGLDLFLDEMPRRIWQFVDRPEDLARIAKLVQAAAGAENLTRDQKKGLEALTGAAEAIERYNRERKEWTPPPAIRDKKFK